jgi:hydroxyacylglutathione hydrolase
MFLHRFHTSGLAINSYLLADEGEKRAVLIDPTRDIELYIQFAKQHGVEIADIVETHVHADFISGSQELKEGLQQKPVIHCSAAGGNSWIPLYADHPVKDKESILLGKVRLEALHTPGHTPEHLIWLCYDETRSSQVPCLAFTGDLIFVGSVGRPDLLGKEETRHLAEQLYQSLFTRLKDLPDFLEIFPGHGAGSLCGKGLSNRATSTLGYERLFNPYLQEKSVEDWIADLQKDIPAAPLRFQSIKHMNLHDASLFSEHKKEKAIIDLRSPEDFAKSHLKGSLNIPMGSSFCTWVSSVFEGNPHLELIADHQEHLWEALKQLRLIGLSDIIKTSIWKEVENQKDVESLPLTSVQQLAAQPKEDSYILDVRTPSEWKSGHIPGAHHLELALVAKHVQQIPKDTFISVICGSGYRASLAASWLRNQGYQVANVQGGMAAWRQANLPLETVNQ